MTDYTLLAKEAAALIDGVSDRISNLSNLSALIYGSLPDLNWAGFYLLKGEELLLGPFQGRPACVKIPVGRGVCGTAVSTGEIQLVEDVHAFPGHIACDSASNSEIVLPIRDHAGKIVGVLDIDSPLLSRFDNEDREGLSKVVSVIETLFSKSSVCQLEEEVMSSIFPLNA